MNMQESIKKIQERLLPTFDDEQLVQQYACWLLEKVTGKTKADLLTKNIELTSTMEDTLEGWLDAMVYHHKPIAYILQEVPFGNLAISVRPPVLIPRPETEEWVLSLIDAIRASGAKQLRILDLCTGSGCIALSLADAFPDAQIVATDISPFALFLVEENKRKLKINNVQCIESDVFMQVPQDVLFDLIVSNPPYITDKEFVRLDSSVKNWEDSRALLAEDDGLAVIKRIIDQAPQFLRPNAELQASGIAQLSIEIGAQQGASVEALMRTSGYKKVVVNKDLARKDRLVSGSISDVAVTSGKR